MAPIRVVLVDDAVVVRKVLTDVLSSDPGIVVVATAPNGRIGLQKIEQEKPDLVILDIEMPEMDGLQALKELRRRDRRTPVVMFSTLTERGASATLEALAHGANDYLTKPTNTGSIAASVDLLKAELIPKVKQLCRRVAAPARPGAGAGTSAAGRVGAPADRPSPGGGAVAVRPTGPPARIDVVAIGISTGGPNALAEVLPALPGDLPVPILIVQHMPPTFTRLLSERLDKACALQVRESAGGELLRPGEVWIAPGDHHMVIRRDGAVVRTALSSDPPENSCRPAVDPLFRSVASVYGAHALGVVMTGMGQDGFLGAEVLVQAGARVIVQDEVSSVVWGMPGFVARAGIADGVLPLGSLAGEIVRRVTASARPAATMALGGSRR